MLLDCHRPAWPCRCTRRFLRRWWKMSPPQFRAISNGQLRKLYVYGQSFAIQPVGYTTFQFGKIQCPAVFFDMLAYFRTIIQLKLFLCPEVQIPADVNQHIGEGIQETAQQFHGIPLAVNHPECEQFSVQLPPEFPAMSNRISQCRYCSERRS